MTETKFEKVKEAFKRVEFALNCLDGEIEAVRRKHNLTSFFVAALIVVEVVRLVAWII